MVARRTGIVAVVLLAFLPAAAGTGAAPAARAPSLEVLGEAPLAFVERGGRYEAVAPSARFSFAPTEARFAFLRGRRNVGLELSFPGASAAPAIGGDGLLPGTYNYFIGNDPAKWRVGLRSFSEVVYRELWPGIDLAFRGEAGRLKYELRVAPGADVSDIRLHYRGVERLSLGRRGELRLETELGVLTDSRPVSYQLADGRRVPVESGYALDGRRGYGFTVGAYDRRRVLVIDPGLLYARFLGGLLIDRGKAIAADAAGNAYVTGLFNSNQAFATKLDAAGAVVYTTLIGPAPLGGLGIAADDSGNAFVTGRADSSSFPTTEGAFDRTYNGGTSANAGDAFVTKLDPAGAIVYSTLLGGEFSEEGRAVAVDPDGNAYVTGITRSHEFPVTSGAFDTTHSGTPGIAGLVDAFVAKLNAAGSELTYATYLGTSNESTGIAVDDGGHAYVAGRSGPDFPTTVGAYDRTYGGGSDATVTKLNAAGSGLVYSTYIGGSGGEIARGIAVDPDGNAYVTGTITTNPSPGFPLVNAFDTSLGGQLEPFVLKLNAAGTGLVYSTYLGGSPAPGTLDEQGLGIAADARGRAYVTGITTSPDFPTTPDAFDRTRNNFSDAFVSALSADGALAYSTFLPPTLVRGLGVATDGHHNVYATGDRENLGNTDVFVVKLDLNTAPTAGDDAYATDEDTPLVVVAPGVLANDDDADGDPLTAVLVAGPANGTLALSADGSFTYTPNPNFNGADSFTYNANDGAADSATAIVTITVNPINDGPVAVDDAYSVNEDETLTVAAPGVFANDSDPDGDALHVGKVSLYPREGTLTLNPDGSFTYTPDPNFNGIDSFSYLANDGGVVGDFATVTITVEPVNDTPVAAGDAYSVDEDTTLAVGAPAVLGNDSDADALTAYLYWTDVVGGRIGRANLDGTGVDQSFITGASTPAGVAVDAGHVYWSNFEGDAIGRANLDGTGVDQSFITGTPEPRGIAVDAAHVYWTTGGPGAIRRADLDGTGEVLLAGLGFRVIALAVDAAHLYWTDTVSDSNRIGRANLDGSGIDSDFITTEAKQRGVAVDAEHLYWTQRFSVGSSIGRANLDGTSVEQEFIPIVSDSADGVAVFGRHIYWINGRDSIGYGRLDGTVLALKLIDGLSGALALAVGSAVDPDADPLAAGLVSGPAHGALTLNADGSFTYTPDANFFGTDGFVYRASDGTLESADTTVTITVNPVDDAPVASADGPYLGIIGSPITFDGSASSDVEGSALTYTWDFGDGSTAVTASPNPTHSYAAAGIYTVTLVVNDGSLDSAPATTSATIGDPIGSGRGDVDAFLSYAAPTERTIALPAATTSFDVTIIYGATIVPATFEVELNGSSFAGFGPAPGTSQTVTIPLSPGRNVLAISVDGTLPDGRTATDRDRLTFVVG